MLRSYYSSRTGLLQHFCCKQKCSLASPQDANWLQGMLPIQYVDKVMCGSEQEPMKTMLGFGVKDAKTYGVSLVGLNCAHKNMLLFSL